MQEVKSDLHELIRMTLLGAQVCSAGTEEEALEWLRAASPAGTTMNWGKSEDPAHAAVACANGNDRHHYVFVC